MPSNETRAGVPYFTAFLLLATVALSVLCVVLVRQNNELKTRVPPRAGPGPAAGSARGPLEVGETVAPLALLRSDGSLVTLGFADSETPPTLMLFTAAGCGYCERATPVWHKVITDLGVGAGGGTVRIVAVQSDARTPADLKPFSPAAPMHLARDAHLTWLTRIPLEPAAVLLDARGVVLDAWFGLPDAADKSALTEALIRAATSGGA